ncbi:MAG: hypothetical protein R6W77_05890 [Trueperaceae bacterium]
MASFTIGEEVLHRGQRYVITTALPDAPYRYRLVATTPEGALVIWATQDSLKKMEHYRVPVDDTSRA